jgi:hypothetical protein
MDFFESQRLKELRKTFFLRPIDEIEHSGKKKTIFMFKLKIDSNYKTFYKLSHMATL